MSTNGTLNMFDLAPRELTNSAIWAWLLDGINQEDSVDPRIPIARRFFENLSLSPPRGAVRISTEKTLPSGARLDVVLEWQDAEGPVFLFIENKVLPAQGLAHQVAGYLKELGDLHERIVPVVLTHDERASDQMAASGLFPKSLPPIFTLRDMLELLTGLDTATGSILGEFRAHLSGKIQKLRQIEQALRRGGADIDYWLPEIQRRGVEDLFSEYLAAAERSGCSGVDFNFGRSVAVRYAPRNGLKGNPVFSLHPKKCDFEQGLWIGYNHATWEKIFGWPFPEENLPELFENQPDSKQPHWHFGFFATVEAVQRLFSF